MAKKLPPAEPSGGSPSDTELQTVRKRSRAREIVLRTLYCVDVRGKKSDVDTDIILEQETNDPDVLRFAKELLNGCLAKRDELDEMIATVAENWQVYRMAVIDRNVLRLGTYELMFLMDIPPKVTINEAIDLAKRYSTAESGSFVNGILDKIRTKVRSES